MKKSNVKVSSAARRTSVMKKGNETPSRQEAGFGHEKEPRKHTNSIFFVPFQQ
jgi:hypothetical protein